MNTLITRPVLEAHLQCKYEAYLRLTGEHGTKSDYEMLLDDRRAEVRRTAIAKIQAPDQEAGENHNTLFDTSLLKRGVLYFFDVTAKTDSLAFTFDGLKKVDGDSHLGPFHYAPILFHEGSTVKKEQRAILELACLVLEPLQGRRPSTGIIYYGKECRSTKARLDANLKKGSRLLSEAVMMASSQSPPRLLLSKHCDFCEFRQRCLQQAVEEDSLSLLRGIGEKDIDRYARKGLLTLTQLAHTFRPRRKGKRQRQSRTRQHALHAMAIRDKTIYVLGTPDVPTTPVNIYLDCEGCPDEGYVYLIGLIVSNGDSEDRYSFWADNRSQEHHIFEQFLTQLSEYEDATVFCYGSYEKTFLQRMRKTAKRKRPVDRVLGALVNTLSLIYSHLYFPCYSNSLKDIGMVLGCNWSDEDASGLQSIVWRDNWEATHDDAWKARLTTYNLEDCDALKKATDFIRAISTASAEDRPTLLAGEELPVRIAEDSSQPRYDWKWGRVNFFHPDFEHINKCAYFDYQRQRVYVRTNKALKRRHARRTKKRNLQLGISKHFTINKSKCPACKQPEARPVAAKERRTNCPVPRTKRAYDLVFTPSSVKRRVLAFHTAVHQCTACENEFIPEEHVRLDRHFHGLKSFIMYLHIGHRLSMETTSRIVADLFGMNVRLPDVHMFKSLMARYYQHAYRNIWNRLLSGTLLHADETEIHMTTESGYVWVFTSMDEVAYVYRPTREGAFLNDLLRSFTGVLVSDFYTAYDSLDCPQQKCLIHLIQDMNRAILTNPFDQDLRAVTEPFGKLLRSIVETVDQHGLKRRALRRHQRNVTGFFRHIAALHLESETADALRSRLCRSQNKLFTFLNYDGVPWNNNNAENAIKRFAYYRERAAKALNQQGLRDYLVLLSICETCRYKGVSFLEYMSSGLKDIEAFCQGKQRRRQRRTRAQTYPKGFIPPNIASLTKRKVEGRRTTDSASTE